MDKIASYKEQIYKEAALKEGIKLYPHQQRVIDNPSNSMIIAHSVGSGKTLTGIAKFENLKEKGEANKALVVVPASLRDNFAREGVKKFTDSSYNVIGNKQEQKKGVYGDLNPDADYNIISYEMFRKDPKGWIERSGADTVITDENHRAKNEGTQTTNSLLETRGMYKNYIGLTGSVISNGIADVQPLVDIAANRNHALGKNKNEFEKMYLKRSDKKAYRGLAEKRKPVVGFKNKKMLKKELLKYIDYTDFDDIKELANMPDKNIQVKKVLLTKEQAKAYKQILKDDPKVRNLIRQRRLETMKNDEIANAFSSLAESRKLMNSISTVKPGMSLEESWKKSSKTRKLIEDLEDHLETTDDGQAIVLTHLVNGGVDVVEAALKEKGIDYGKFIGKNKEVTEEKRQQDVVDYNDRKKRVMIISPAGNEGLSLNDTTWEGVLDPHFNPEKMNQLEARGVRSGGLSHRDDEDREVLINRYISTMPKTLGFIPNPTKTPDEFIYELAQNKDKNNKIFYNYIKKIRKNK